MTDSPLVTIIVNNYNYARYVGAAVESTLAQTYAPVEVIVVDDGSADNSPEIIADYGNRILPLFKRNGGQASALNAGLEAAQGEIVMFLDADDMLRPNTAARVVRALRENPNAVRVQYRLDKIDAQGTRLNATLPAVTVRLPHGDLRPQVLHFPDDVPSPPTSGNAFRRSVLQKIFPVPEDAYRLYADYYLLNLTPLFGPVCALDDIGGMYRVHDRNRDHRSSFDLARTREIIRMSCITHQYLGACAHTLGLSFYRDPAAVLAVTFLAHRMLSLKLEPALHPIPCDTIGFCLQRGIRAAYGRFDVYPARRAAYALWFLLLAAAPAGGTRRLAARFLNG